MLRPGLWYNIWVPNKNTTHPPVSAAAHPGAWILPQNDVWNVPVEDEQLEAMMVGNQAVSYRGLVVDTQGGIYGVRNMGDVRSGGYNAYGRVSLGGKKVAAWTSDRLFQRPDGSLCKVAVIVVHAPNRADVALLKIVAA